MGNALRRATRRPPTLPQVKCALCHQFFPSKGGLVRHMVNKECVHCQLCYRSEAFNWDQGLHWSLHKGGAVYRY